MSKVEFEYGSIKGYQPKRLTNKHLARYRTGNTPGNPAETLLLVKEIDKLRSQLLDREKEIEALQQEINNVQEEQ